MAAIITAHMVHMRTASEAVQAEVIGMANADLDSSTIPMPPIPPMPVAEPMSPISARRKNRYAQHAAVTVSRPTPMEVVR